jgi:hypothetical protein
MAARVKELLLRLLHHLGSGCFLLFLGLQTTLFHQMLLVFSCGLCEPVHCTEVVLIITCIPEAIETVKIRKFTEKH